VSGKRVRNRSVSASGLLLLAALVVAGVVADPVTATPKTTEPGVADYKIAVVLTDKAITIARNEFSAGDGIARWPRGSQVDFVVRNKGSQPHVARLKLVSQHYFSKYEQAIVEIPVGHGPIQPGQVRHLGINFYYRGVFAFQLMASDKPLASAQIVIF